MRHLGTCLPDSFVFAPFLEFVPQKTRKSGIGEVLAKITVGRGLLIFDEENCTFKPTLWRLPHPRWYNQSNSHFVFALLGEKSQQPRSGTQTPERSLPAARTRQTSRRSTNNASSTAIVASALVYINNINSLQNNNVFFSVTYLYIGIL